MGKTLAELDPFFWMMAFVIACITTVDLTGVEVVNPYSDFVQAMPAPVEPVQ